MNVNSNFINLKERLLINKSTFRLPDSGLQKKKATHTRKKPKNKKTSVKKIYRTSTTAEKIFQKNLRKNGGGISNFKNNIYMAF